MKNLIKLGVLVALLANSTSVRAQSDQSVLARQLAEGTRDEQLGVADIVSGIPVEQMAPGLRTALIGALEREGAMQARAARRGVFVDSPELLARLAFAAYWLEDPSAIPGLAGALGMSPPAIEALGRFGDPAVGAVIDALEGSDDGAVLMDGLLALRYMVEGHGGAPLSAANRERVLEIAAGYLAQPGFVTTLWRTIDLAGALGDGDLMAVVASLATDPAEVERRGVSDEEAIRHTQRVAADALAGVPPQPQCCTDFSDRRGPPRMPGGR